MSSTPKAQNHPGPGLAILIEAFRNPGFVVCLVLLAAFTIGFKVLTKYKDIQFQKLPLPMKHPLSDLNQKKLLPYKLIQPIMMKQEILDQLGTDEYIQWILEDTTEGSKMGPEKIVHLFVTYYTGTPDPVPHVPDECYLGSGYRVIGDEAIEVPIPALGEHFKIPVRVMEFEKSALLRRENRIVMYTFNANGQFRASRTGVRTLVNNPRYKHAYFSKVELTFGTQDVFPSKAKSIEAGTRFLQVVIPVLVEDHWPDWEAAVKASESQEDSGEAADTEISESNAEKSTLGHLYRD